MTGRWISVSVSANGDPPAPAGPWKPTELVIGRDPSCDVVLSSVEVSRSHVRVALSDDCLRISDSSVNGTRLGKRIVRNALADLAGEAELGIGPYQVHLRVEDETNLEPHRPDHLRLRRHVHRALLDHLDLASIDHAQMNDHRMRPKVVEALGTILEDDTLGITEERDRQRLIDAMVDEVLGLGPLQPLLEDSSVSEIMVVDPQTIYVERSGVIDKTESSFTDHESCRAVIERVVGPLGRRIDESAPLVDARLPDGSRVNAIIPPLAVRGPCITIRKFPQQALTMSDLVTMGSISSQIAGFLERCVQARKNILISGGTGSGKTTLLNILSGCIPTGERIVTIEDAAELRLQQPHVVSLEARPSNLEGLGGFSIRDLVKNALRMRPDRIIVGECRSGEAIDMLQAMNTGHEGSMTTTHANSALEAVRRIETLCMMAGLGHSRAAIREQVTSGIDVVVQQRRFFDGSRRITTVAEVLRSTGGSELGLRPIFRFRQERVDDDGRVIGKHHHTGLLPTFVSSFSAIGVKGSGDCP